MQPTPNLDDLYAVLTGWAGAEKTHTYSDLSRDYQQLTGDWFHWHGTWDYPLGDLNQHVHDTLRAPAISSLVVLKDGGEPGGEFWDSAYNVPPRPRDDLERLEVWIGIVKAVFAFPWPNRLP